MPRILSIDFGSKRCGIAVTDESQIIASGLNTVITENLIDFLKDYFKNEEVELVVVGLPKNMKNVESLIEPLILKYIKIINDNFPLLSIERFDERFTSKLAFQAMIDGGLKKKKRKNKETIDMVSATIILQDYLRSRKV
ncbi:MAG: putative Holliday junction resolvase [Flavobacteriaceae bacterium]|jgi:putative Holliday junction resolvase|tara:strand:+ start:1213 stop:1629 length:417 start_codon:yes stop_codon:yes gene_type:complete